MLSKHVALLNFVNLDKIRGLQLAAPRIHPEFKFGETPNELKPKKNAIKFLLDLTFEARQLIWGLSYALTSPTMAPGETPRKESSPIGSVEEVV
ncbi:hypothetical protein Tco_0937959 [Tanacetum coccineum]|uniref:Uncharacterized protein n=1 Tax=Tanacetum coccineum TaxID=301880 RepID=A0ABQ5DMS8_9ASTR